MDSLEFVRRLAAHGADLNARMTSRTTAGLSSLNMVGATPFLMAARTGDAELMRLLAAARGKSHAAESERDDTADGGGGSWHTFTGEDAGAESEVLEAVKVAIELGNDMNAVDEHGETAMHGAAYNSSRWLYSCLRRRARRSRVWNRKNRAGWTPLRIAEGVHRTGNLRSSARQLLQRFGAVMSAAGVSTAVEPGGGGHRFGAIVRSR